MVTNSPDAVFIVVFKKVSKYCVYIAPVTERTTVAWYIGVAIFLLFILLNTLQ